MLHSSFLLEIGVRPWIYQPEVDGTVNCQSFDRKAVPRERLETVTGLIPSNSLY